MQRIWVEMTQHVSMYMNSHDMKLKIMLLLAKRVECDERWSENLEGLHHFSTAICRAQRQEKAIHG